MFKNAPPALASPTKHLEEGERQRRPSCSCKHILIFLPGFSRGKNLDPMTCLAARKDRECELLDGRECTWLKCDDIVHIRA